MWQAAQENLLLDEQAKQRDLMVENLSSSREEESNSVASDQQQQPALRREEELGEEERPLSGGGRTFQQLLAEKLPEDSAGAEMTGETPPSKARPFLRKGAGLAKYKMSQQETPVKRRTPSPRKTPSEGRKLSSALVVGSDPSGSSGGKSVSIKSPPRQIARLCSIMIPSVHGSPLSLCHKELDKERTAPSWGL